MSFAFLRIGEPEGEARFRFIDGVRVLCLMWITAFHVIFYCSFFPLPGGLPKTQANALFTAWPSRWVLRGHFALDVLFVVTGFLIGYYVLVDADRGKLSYRAFLVRRLARLVPAYIAVLILYHFTMNFNFETVWTNLLFVNNYVPLIHQTMSWSWSLPVDVHFYFLFPLLLVFVRDRRARLFSALWLVFCALFVVRGIVEATAHVAPPLFANPHGTRGEQELFNHYFDSIYDKTHTRIGAIVCGLMVATLIRYHDAENWLVKYRGVAGAIFVVAAALAIAVLAAPVMYGEAPSFDPAWAAAYLICYNYLFALGIAAAMLVLLSDNPLGRPIRALLSHPWWYVPSELCYGVFLLNPMVVLALYAFIIKSPTIAPGPIALYTVSAILCAFACAYVLYVLIERPFRTVGKRLARRLEPVPRPVLAPVEAMSRSPEPASAFLHD
ncbi:MAG: acyltransferase [Candidatus Eremiobacteraeota bacterium]|nr:acyltransferase [Candidatus Eremiobacteraeota bacterium]